MLSEVGEEDQGPGSEGTLEGGDSVGATCRERRLPQGLLRPRLWAWCQGWCLLWSGKEGAHPQGEASWPWSKRQREGSWCGTDRSES